MDQMIGGLYRQEALLPQRYATLLTIKPSGRKSGHKSVPRGMNRMFTPTHV
jgi:hypothetical protein